MLARAQLSVNPRLCIGCEACVVACERLHGVAYVHVVYSERARTFIPITCHHCIRAPCVHACPTGACHRSPEGVVVIDWERCIGCGACAQACPFGAIVLVEDRGVYGKCDLCLPRLRVGLPPACAATCPTGAIVFSRHGEVSRVRRAEHAARVERQLVEAERLTHPHPPQRYG